MMNISARFSVTLSIARPITSGVSFWLIVSPSLDKTLPQPPGRSIEGHLSISSRKERPTRPTLYRRRRIVWDIGRRKREDAARRIIYLQHSGAHAGIV
jgi:hypothetical protein